MIEWWNTISVAEQVFSGIAIGFGSTLLVLLIISLIGGEVDFDVDTDIDLDGGDNSGLSVKAILSFLTFFGFGGWSVVSFHGPLWLAIIVALVTGYICMSLLALLLTYLMRLSHDGGREVEAVLQQRGEIYLRVPANRTGQGLIHVRMGSRLVELNAITNGLEIASGKEARVIQILSDNLVLVEEMPSADT